MLDRVYAKFLARSMKHSQQVVNRNDRVPGLDSHLLRFI